MLFFNHSVFELTCSQGDAKPSARATQTLGLQLLTY
jgi:hypothetical protein